MIECLLQFAIIGVTLLAVLGSAVAQNDVDILNFALNLECLEAAYYSCAAYGADLSAAYLGMPSSIPLLVLISTSISSHNDSYAFEICCLKICTF